MHIRLLFQYALICQTLLCVGCLSAMWRRGSIANFKMLSLYLAIESLSNSILVPVMFFYRNMGLDKLSAYHIYYYVLWTTFFIQAAVLIGILYGVFHLAMRPLKGLHEVGKIIFRWVAGVAVVLSLALGLGPQISSPSSITVGSWIAASSHIMQGISILTLCLLLFVCFAIKPLGLTYGSRIFGVSVGLGIGATVQLVQWAWVAIHQVQSIYDPIYLFYILGTCVGYSVWLVYFAKPEPARRMILLPTTSPYFFWNAISEALRDEPGHVAVGGVAPSMFGTQELDVLLEQAALESTLDDLPALSSPIRRPMQVRQLNTFG